MSLANSIRHDFSLLPVRTGPVPAFGETLNRDRQLFSATNRCRPRNGFSATTETLALVYAMPPPPRFLIHRTSHRSGLTAMRERIHRLSSYTALRCCYNTERSNHKQNTEGSLQPCYRLIHGPFFPHTVVAPSSPHSPILSCHHSFPQLSNGYSLTRSTPAR
jgi:hypothetical protein